jgi:hypothetical protein
LVKIELLPLIIDSKSKCFRCLIFSIVDYDYMCLLASAKACHRCQMTCRCPIHGLSQHYPTTMLLPDEMTPVAATESTCAYNDVDYSLRITYPRTAQSTTLPLRVPVGRESTHQNGYFDDVLDHVLTCLVNFGIAECLVMRTRRVQLFAPLCARGSDLAALEDQVSLLRRLGSDRYERPGLLALKVRSSVEHCHDAEGCFAVKDLLTVNG